MSQYEKQCGECGSTTATIFIAEGHPDVLTAETADYIGCYNCQTITEVGDD